MYCISSHTQLGGFFSCLTKKLSKTPDYYSHILDLVLFMVSSFLMLWQKLVFKQGLRHSTANPRRSIWVFLGRGRTMFCKSPWKTQRTHNLPSGPAVVNGREKSPRLTRSGPGDSQVSVKEQKWRGCSKKRWPSSISCCWPSNLLQAVVEGFGIVKSSRLLQNFLVFSKIGVLN